MMVRTPKRSSTAASVKTTMYIPPAFRVQDASQADGVHSEITPSRRSSRTTAALRLPANFQCFFVRMLGVAVRCSPHMAGAPILNGGILPPEARCWPSFTGRTATFLLRGIRRRWPCRRGITPPFTPMGFRRSSASTNVFVSLLRETVSTYESSFERPWPGNLPDDYRDKMMQNIVAFEIPIRRIEEASSSSAKADRPRMRQGVFDALSRSEDADSQALAKMMVAECNVQGERMIDHSH